MAGKRKRGARKKAKDVTTTVRNPKQEMLLREMKLAILNTERDRRFWRETIMRIKLPDIGRNVEIAWQTMERSFDFKDYSISLLVDGLQEIEDQRRRANRAQTETFDRSLQAHEHRLKAVDAIFHQNIDKLLNEKHRELKSIDYSRNTAESVLRKIAWRVNRRDENASNMAKSIAVGKIDTFAEDGQNMRRVIGAQLEKRIEDLWNELRNVFADYRKSTSSRRKAYEIIRKKDEVDRQKIIAQWQRIAIILDEITKLREKIHSYNIDATTELRDITQQSDLVQALYRERNKRFVLDQQEDKRKAAIMSKEYSSTVKRFQKLINKAERILSYVQICRKYETQDEKIVQTINNYALSQTQPIAVQIKGLPLQLALKDYDNSISFCHRLGLAQLIAIELRIERDRLLSKTSDLRKSITRYLVYETPAISAS